MKSIWKGHIQFSLVTIPIQVFNAVENDTQISFNQLHKTDNGRVSYKKVCKKCDQELVVDDIVKAYEYSPDQYVVIQDEDFDKIKLKSTRAIEINHFAELHEVHPTRFESVYYIGPNGDIAKKTFQLLVQTLTKSQKAGVGRIVLRDREDMILLAAHGNGLIMYKLRFPDEIRKINDVPDLEESPVDESQLKLAETLVDSLSTSFDKLNFQDRYRDALNEIIDEKIRGNNTFKAEQKIESTPAVDIMTALKQSIEAAKEKKIGA